MSSPFFKLQPDGFFQDAGVIQGMFAGGASAQACVIAAPGPTLRDDLAVVEDKQYSVFYINRATEVDECAGPNLWTSYDPVRKFDADWLSRPQHMKFVHKGRASEALEGCNLTIGDMPNVWFFDSAPKDGASFFGHGPINDSKDSLIQAMDIAIRLGFRRICLAGVQLYVPLSPAQLSKIKKYLPEFEQPDLANSLWETAHEVVKVRDTTASPDGVKVREFVEELGTLGSEKPYCFGSANVDFPLQVLMDHHYRQVACWLRQSVRCLGFLGVDVTLLNHKPSRLTGIFKVHGGEPVWPYSPPDYRQNKSRPVRFEPYYRPSSIEVPTGQKG